ncbi:hypothetical protein QFC19_002548 [Naganishia cerealis]|uniref:Uncharacterized protein n=1 Tax=Naganishia cerealis TaxID=610337 RepID=A0ACC2W8L4_9TREE|nr:hypothetical protein QFC19_002548 [Naganishia cerealis]
MSATFRHLVARNNIPLPNHDPVWDRPIDSASAHEFSAILPELNQLFLGNPSLRVTLVKCLQSILINRLDLCPAFVTSPLFPSIIRSLQLDVNSYLVAQSIKLTIILIPHAPAEVAKHVPVLLSVLIRTAVWKKRTKVSKIPQWGLSERDGNREPVNTVPSSDGFLGPRLGFGRRSYLNESSPGSDSSSMITVKYESLAEITPPPKPGLGWRLASASTSGTQQETWAQPPSVINPPPLPSHPSPINQSPVFLQIEDATRTGLKDNASPLPTRHSQWLEETIENQTLQKLLALYNPSQDLARGLLLELYGSWPANVMSLVRDPALYLEHMGVESPYNVGWEEVWRKKEVIALRGFLVNPIALQANPEEEIQDTVRFTRQTTSEIIAQSHALWLGSILPRADGTSLVGPMHPSPSGKSSGWDAVPMDQMASPTETLSSSGGSVTGRYHSSRPHRDGGHHHADGISIGPGPTGTYVSSQTAPITIRTGISVGGHNGAGTESLQAEVDGLKREKEFLECDLKYAKTLAASYLQPADKAKESIAKMQMEQRETRQIQREEKKARALETSQSRAEIEDQTVSVAATGASLGMRFVNKSCLLSLQRMLEAQKLELARVKEAHFKLNNKLREAEPKIKHIADYEKEVDKLYHNQLLWDADIRKQKETESSLSKMMSAFKQMELVLARYEKDKQSLQTENQRQADHIAKLQAEIARLSTQPPVPQEIPEDIASTIRQDLEVLQSKLKEARTRIDALEADKLEVGWNVNPAMHPQRITDFG